MFFLFMYKPMVGLLMAFENYNVLIGLMQLGARCSDGSC